MPIAVRSVCLPLLAAVSGATARAQDKLTLTYLANEGVVLSAGGRQVIIDGLFRFYGRDFAVAPDSVRAALEAARPPYDGIDLLLVTHRHGDHFHPVSVASHLAANSNAHLLTSGQVIDSLRGSLREPHRVVGRIHRQRVAAHTKHRDTINGITVESLGLIHNPHQGIEHLGYVVELGGYRVLHIGDADLEPNRYQALELGRIDVALVHSWMVTTASGKRVLEEIIRPKHVVVFHLSETDRDRTAARVQSALPNAVTLMRPLHQLTF
jgi:L-ascorbate metabolism protein UlaG (beta-lactamase superfamily)